MPEKISWISSVQVAGGPKISTSATVEVTAYDKIQVVIPGANKFNGAEPTAHDDNFNVLSPTTVEVHPAANERLQLLAITADRYSEDLIYTVTGQDAERIALDGSQVLLGGGILALFPAPPRSLDFRNGLGLDEDVTVTILVGREAT